jgi:hypothetical protein
MGISHMDYGEIRVAMALSIAMAQQALWRRLSAYNCTSRHSPFNPIISGI